MNDDPVKLVSGTARAKCGQLKCGKALLIEEEKSCNE